MVLPLQWHTMWAAFALLAAFTWASSDAAAKRAMDRGVQSLRVLQVRYLIAIPALLPLLILGIPTLDRTFWLIHIVWLPLEIAATLLYIRAIRISPLSLTLPFLALTPLFLTITGWIFLGERVGATGFVGIVLVVIGSYVTNLPHALRHPLAPFHEMFREPGTRLMLIVAFLYAFTSICGKVLVDHSSPSYFTVHYALIMFFLMSLIVRTQTTPAPQHLLSNRPLLVVSGVMFAASILGHMFALHTTPTVAYMIAMKRLSGAFGVLYGWATFGEEHLGARLVGSLIMVAGATLILLD